ncbi:MAG: AAA domain-containing protein [Candidatus Altiarchaeales archaeon]|nr:AAA domain-containing protein [Candidatus Altiarchaeales archaeon]
MGRLKSFEDFLKKYPDKIQALQNYPETKSVVLDYQELWGFDEELAERLRSHPDEHLLIFNDTLAAENIETKQENPRFNIRFKNFPQEKPYSLFVRDIVAEYIGVMISVEGVVNRISDVLPKVLNALFICNRCSEHNWVSQEKRMLIEPARCRSCGKADFRFIPEESQWIDIQRLEIQEPLEMLKGGEQARRIEVWLEDDLTDKVTAGDKVIVTGTVRLLPPKTKGSVFHKYIEANYIESVEREFEEIEITPQEEEQIITLSKDPLIYEKIIDSIAPSIYGYREVKEAIALQLFGGRHGKKLPDGTKVRPDMHLLLIGDPGVAKSRILQYVDQIAPKSIYVTGKGTTGAGLTATAEKDELSEGGWTLKAGALVLAGGGVAGIDEFDKMGTEDRSSMHEAMEQQTISIAKAGIITKFKANTSILAAANPKFSRFDNYKPLAEQFDIPPTLISRFDLIFPIRDILDRERDRGIAQHMLKMHKGTEEMQEITPSIEPELFRKYIAYARKKINPQLTDEAGEKIQEYYVELRSRGHGTTAAATPRQLEALVRIAESSAKIKLRDEVGVEDVGRAIKLTEFVLREIAYDEATGELDIDRVVTTHPKSARDRIHSIEEILRELMEESADGMAERKDVVERAKEKGIERYTVDKIVNELRNKGIIYSPKPRFFMFTE